MDEKPGNPYDSPDAGAIDGADSEVPSGVACMCAILLVAVLLATAAGGCYYWAVTTPFMGKPAQGERFPFTWPWEP